MRAEPQPSAGWWGRSRPLTGWALLSLAALAPACVPGDFAQVDPRETAFARPSSVELPGRRASARLEPIGRRTLRGTVFFRELPRELAVEAVVASVEPGLYRLVLRQAADCSRPAAAPRFTPPSAPGSGSDDAGLPGDLGLLEVSEEGAGRLVLTTSALSLESDGLGIVGTIVTLAPDGRENEPVACGVVEAER